MAIVEELDRPVILHLRDGRLFYGILRSFDHRANMVLEDCWERSMVGDKYADERRGLEMVRGENLVLMGGLEDHKPDMPAGWSRVDPKELTRLEREKKQEEEEAGAIRSRLLDLVFE